MEIGREIRPQPDHIITTLLLFKNFDYASKFLIRPFLKAHMGTAFIWAVEHDELRKCKKPVWKITFVRQNSTTSCKICLRQRGDFDHTPLPRNKDACERARGGKENASLLRGARGNRGVFREENHRCFGGEGFVAGKIVKVPIVKHAEHACFRQKIDEKSIVLCDCQCWLESP